MVTQNDNSARGVELSPDETRKLWKDYQAGTLDKFMYGDLPLGWSQVISKAQIEKLIALGWESPEDIVTKLNAAIFSWLDIEHPCPTCGGRGRRSYPSTATWHGGIGGQMITGDVCDTCWGSGDADRHWTNLRVLRYILTPEQVKKYREATEKGSPALPLGSEAIKP